MMVSIPLKLFQQEEVENTFHTPLSMGNSSLPVLFKLDFPLQIPILVSLIL